MAKGSGYGGVRALVAADDRGLRDGLAAAFKRAGIPQPTIATTPAQLRAALDAGHDLVVMTDLLAGDFVAPMVSEVRRGQLGPQPFPIVAILVAGDDRDHIRQVSNCGPDDIVSLPTTPDEVLERIGVRVEGQRKPLVVTPGYAGPERRTGARAGA